MLVVMAGLPGTGKSTLAEGLAKELGAVVLSKDTVRRALFPPSVLDYSREQDDLCMKAIYQAAGLILKKGPERTVIIDGRTFLRTYQLIEVSALAESLGQQLRIIECAADEAVIILRLESDARKGIHPAGNRDFALYQKLKAEAEPIVLPRLVLDTGSRTAVDCICRCVAYLRDG